MLMCNQLVSFDNIEILASSSTKFHSKINKILLILHDQPISNKDKAFLPIYLLS